MGCIFDIVVFDHTALFAAAVAQHLMGYLWFGVLFHQTVRHYLAVDKSVQRPERAKQRYLHIICHLGSFVEHSLRAAATMTILALASAAGTGTTPDSQGILAYGEAAFAFALVASAARLNYALWEQRPIPLIFVSVGSEVVSAVVASVVLFAFKK